ncbi:MULTISPECIES: hypothetical protein [Clostridium]|uniref:Uncharacterized protein n=1 Tax=Clostridium cadaveris TaxID=1529 RepID=A0A1I2L832_9CLOT|nr:hypothetical protein [Clostridium cadaveris]MDM8311580.1 hypothetical protein [Clostridium cadaveris]MDU4951607.1 hypothetical protein [Clostridium sp.]SFF73256.1 hypothetical protein SAMN04487885_10894 [Clostridium cadaveris]
MNIIDMRGDFENFYDEAKVIGKWTAFKKYYEKYSELFDLIS